jgi:hypothetical protein
MNKELTIKEKIEIAQTMVRRLEKLNNIVGRYKTKNEDNRDNSIRRGKTV